MDRCGMCGLLGIHRDLLSSNLKIPEMRRTRCVGLMERDVAGQEFELKCQMVVRDAVADADLPPGTPGQRHCCCLLLPPTEPHPFLATHLILTSTHPTTTASATTSTISGARVCPSLKIQLLLLLNGSISQPFLK